MTPSRPMPYSRREAPAWPVSALAKPRHEQHEGDKSKHPVAAHPPADIQNHGLRFGVSPVVGPHQRRQIHGDHAKHGLQDTHEHGRECDVALRVHRVLSQSRDGIEADVRERRNAGAEHHRAHAERLRPPDSPQVEQAGKTVRPGHVACGQGHEQDGARRHDDHHHGTGPGRYSNAGDIDEGQAYGEQNRPCEVRNLWRQTRGCERRVDDAEQRNQEVIQHHGPAGEEADVRVERALRVCIGRASRRKRARHLAIAGRSEKHGHHRHQVTDHRMAVRCLLNDPVNRVRRGGRENHEAVENKVATRQDPLQ